MKAKLAETRPAARRIPAEIEALARAKGQDPRALLAWAVRPDGRAVIVAADGRKFVSD